MPGADIDDRAAAARERVGGIFRGPHLYIKGRQVGHCPIRGSKTQGGQQTLGFLFRCHLSKPLAACPRELQRQQNVLPYRQIRDQIEHLENETEMFPPKAVALAGAKLMNGDTQDADRTRLRLEDAADQPNKVLLPLPLAPVRSSRCARSTRSSSILSKGSPPAHVNSNLLIWMAGSGICRR